MTQERRILELLKGSAFLRSRDLDKHRLPRTVLMRLVHRGQVVRAQRGLYMLPGGPETEHISLLEVAKKVPGGVICLLTALRFHGIGTQDPYQVWIAIGRKSKRPKISQILVRFVRFSDTSLYYGVEAHKILGTTLMITSPAKTVADCFKYRNKVGLDVAIEALREGCRAKRFSSDELYRAAQVCRIWKVLKPYAETMI
jgi:predicted transcriptional regulator of viral defense system